MNHDDNQTEVKTSIHPWGLDCLEQGMSIKPPAPIDKPSHSDVNSTLASRQSSHGNFTDNSILMQDLKERCRDSLNWSTLPAYQQEAIDMICHKLGRILTGDPIFVDHWHDICGYSQLVENILTTGQSHPAVKK